MLELKPYQRQAVDQLVTSVSSLLHKEEPKSVCVFQAPTGSGKTIMTAIFIDEVIKSNPAHDLCFLWVSIGKGDLHLQSKNSLERIFEGRPKVSLLEREFFGSRNVIGHNEVVVVNWEKIRTKDRDTGDWKNVVMRDGERINFREVLEQTREVRKIILVIDESHYGASAERTQELRNEIDADVVLEMSATPKFQPKPAEIASGKAGYVMVDPKAVIDEGMIKKEIIINDGVKGIVDDELDSQDLILTAAYNKRLELKRAYEALGISINPLVIVQIPNADKGDEKRLRILEFLRNRDIVERVANTGNGKVAQYLSGVTPSQNLGDVSLPNCEIEFLIFKQAIDTGWDCPRAHILVKLRESKSETFEIQTIGRILRMPEQRHYSIDALNTGYIFTNVQSVLVKKEEYNPNIIKHLVAKNSISVAEHELVSYYRTRVDYGDVGSSFVAVFEHVANKFFDIDKNQIEATAITKVSNRGVDLSLNTFTQEIITDLAITSSIIDDLAGELTNWQTTDVNISGSDLLSLFNEFIRVHLGPFKNIRRSTPSVRQAIYVWFRKYVGAKDWENSSNKIQQVVLQVENSRIFSAILSEAIRDYEQLRRMEVLARLKESEIHYPFDLPQEVFFNQYTDEQVDAKKYLLNPAYLDINRSQPERQFEAYLEGCEAIKWWWKNGESKREYFAVRYEYPANEPHAFYPDYIVKTSTGLLGIIEIKDSHDSDGETITRAKIHFLSESIAEKNSPRNIFTTLAVRKSREILAPKNQNYDWLKTLSGDWSDWLDFDSYLSSTIAT